MKSLNMLGSYHILRDFIKNNFFTIITILVAIGAYSTNSLFVELLKNNNKFQVRNLAKFRSVGYNSSFMIADSLPDGSFIINPTQVIMFTYVRNISENDQVIEAIQVEVQKKDGSWVNVLVNDKNRFDIMGNDVNDIKNDVFFSTDGSIERCLLLEFKNNLLLENISNTVIEPNETRSGWLLLSFPHNHWYNKLSLQPLRITFYSGFGEKETHSIKFVDIPKGATNTHYSTLARHPDYIIRDLSNSKFKYYSDTIDRLNFVLNQFKQ